MKLALAYILQGEERFIDRSLPLMASEIGNVIALSCGVTEETKKIITESGGIVFDEAWDYDLHHARNSLIQHAQDLDFDWILFMRGDECMMPGSMGWIANHFTQMASSRKIAQAVFFPRLTFWKSQHYVLQSANDFPDWQGRLIRVPRDYSVGVVFEAKNPDMPTLNGLPLIIRPEALFSGLTIYNYALFGAKDLDNEDGSARHYFGPVPLAWFGM